MAISKELKQELIKQYVADLKDANNVVVVKQNGVSVDSATKVRREVREAEGKVNVVRKRLFLRAVKEADFQDVGIGDLDGSVFALYANGDGFGPLKAVNKYKKEFSKEEDGAELTFLWGWFDGSWKDGQYVTELANIPSQEELISKLLYLLQYPIQNLAATLAEVAKKGGVVEEKKEEVKEEAKEEEKVEAPVEEAKAEEVKEESAEAPAEEEKKEEVAEATEEKSEETPAEESSEEEKKEGAAE